MSLQQDLGYAETVLELSSVWHFKWHRRRSTSEHSREEKLLSSAAGPPALLTWQHSCRYRPGSIQLSLSKTASRLRLEASMVPGPFPVGSLQVVSSVWKARGFHATDAVVPWDTEVLGALIATRHSQQAHLPWSRGQPLAPSLQATQAAYLFVWSQAKQQHAWPYMPQRAELLSLAAKHPDRSPSAATQGVKPSLAALE